MSKAFRGEMVGGMYGSLLVWDARADLGPTSDPSVALTREQVGPTYIRSSNRVAEVSKWTCTSKPGDGTIVLQIPAETGKLKQESEKGPHLPRRHVVYVVVDDGVGVSSLPPRSANLLNEGRGVVVATDVKHQPHVGEVDACRFAREIAGWDAGKEGCHPGRRRRERGSLPTRQGTRAAVRPRLSSLQKKGYERKNMNNRTKEDGIRLTPPW